MPQDDPEQAYVLRDGQGQWVMTVVGATRADIKRYRSALGRWAPLGEFEPLLSPPPRRDKQRELAPAAFAADGEFERLRRRVISADGEGNLPLLLDAANRRIDEYNAALGKTRRKRAQRADLLQNLARAQVSRYELTGDRASLEQARKLWDKCTRLAPKDWRAWHGLGDALLRRFEQTGDESSLDRGLEVVRRAVSLATDDPVSPLSDLGGALHYRFELHGRAADLDAAVEAHRAALRAAPSGHRDWGAIQGNLGSILLERFDFIGDTADLDDAVTAHAKAVKVTPAHHPFRAAAQMNLAEVLVKHFEVTGALESLDAAIAALRGAATITMASTQALSVLQRCQLNLGNALRQRYEVTGDESDYVEAAQTVMQLLDGAENVGQYLLARAALIAYQLHNDPELLDIAISCMEGTLHGLFRGIPDRTHLHFELAQALSHRFGRSSDQQDRRAALREYRAIAQTDTAPAIRRADAARAWAELEGAVRDGDLEAALDGYQTAVQMLDLVAWRGIRRVDRERLLRRFGGLASDAAACALRAGRPPEQAVELLEQGRGILLAQTIEARSDHERLREAFPDLAGQLAQIHDALEYHSRLPLDQRVAYARKREQLITQIRARRGFSDFLRPATFAELRTVSAEGPVVIVNVSQFRCDALTLIDDQAIVTPLPGLSETILLRRAIEFTTAVEESATGNTPATQAVVARTLDWLWGVVAQPILTDLKLHQLIGDQPPRLWWCPTGLLSYLPLHAAAPLSGGPGLLDLVVSSYAPTLRVLLHARQTKRQPPAGNSMLAVVPTLGDPTALPYAKTELAELRNAIPQTVSLDGPAATIAATSQAMTRHPWAHFLCHHLPEPADAVMSGLHLHDGPLTARQIGRLRLEHAELAYLAACQTHLGEADLTDEAITLATAFHVAGYRNVIATLWQINDPLSAKVTRDVYSLLTTRERAINASASACALNTAVRSLRDLLPDMPTIWASYVHLGP
jgi:hypothetical protein